MTLTDEKIVEILNRYHEAARANDALPAVAAELESDGGREEILYEIEEHTPELVLAELDDVDLRRLRHALDNYGRRLSAELAAAALTPGERVRILATEGTRLGALAGPEEILFVATVAGGVEGTFRGRHPNELLEGWVLVDVDRADAELADAALEPDQIPEVLVVPVRSSSIERVQ